MSVSGITVTVQDIFLIIGNSAWIFDYHYVVCIYTFIESETPYFETLSNSVACPINRITVNMTIIIIIHSIFWGVLFQYYNSIRIIYFIIYVVETRHTVHISS